MPNQDPDARINSIATFTESSNDVSTISTNQILTRLSQCRLSPVKQRWPRVHQRPTPLRRRKRRFHNKRETFATTKETSPTTNDASPKATLHFKDDKHKHQSENYRRFPNHDRRLPNNLDANPQTTPNNDPSAVCLTFAQRRPNTVQMATQSHPMTTHACRTTTDAKESTTKA